MCATVAHGVRNLAEMTPGFETPTCVEVAQWKSRNDPGQRRPVWRLLPLFASGLKRG